MVYGTFFVLWGIYRLAEQNSNHWFGFVLALLILGAGLASLVLSFRTWRKQRR